MRFSISRSLKSVFAEGSEAAGKIQFNLIAQEFDFLEIDKDYVVCSEKLLRLKKIKRQAVVVSLDILNIDKISDEEKTKYSIGGKNVGYGIFVKEKETSEEYFDPILIIRIFLKGEIISKIFSCDLKNNIGNYVDLDFSNTTYGWEPDLSHSIWHSIDGELYVKNAQLQFVEIDKTEQKINEEEEKFWEDRDAKKNIGKKFSIEEGLIKLQRTVYLLIFLAIFYIFKNIN